MTEQDFRAAMDAAVTRWRQNHAGELLTCIAFPQAQPAQCHDNAAAFVATHGGQVVHGFLVQHPHAWSQVWVIPHSVVRTAAGLKDVTLSPTQLLGLGFFALDGKAVGFVDLAKRYPREIWRIVD